MRHFYKQISVDAENMRFYAACPICGSRQYSKKLPLLCRSKAQLPLYETGAASGMRQRSFLSARASASMALAVKFNLCRRCGRWVCDDCFVLGAEEDVCAICSDGSVSSNE